MIDPLEEIAEVRLIALSADIELQLEHGAGLRPVVFMLASARKRAAAANVQLVIADPHDWIAVQKLQNEIALYDDMVKACRELLQRGKEADRKIGEEERGMLQQMLSTEEGRQEARLLGIQFEGTDT